MVQMEFDESIELGELRKMVRAFAEREIAPLSDELDRKEELAPGIFNRFGDLGLLGVTVPEQYGGSGLGAQAACVVMEELSAVDPGICLSYLAHTLLFVHNLANNGSDEQLKMYLPGAIAGTHIGGMGMTEPEYGSDAVGMRTRAVKHQDIYLVDGTKMFITNGPVGKLFLVYVRTSEDRRGLSTLIVESTSEGFSVGKKLSKMGMRSSPTSELIFRACKVPVSNLVGSEGDCIRHMMRNLDIERAGLAAMSLGIARSCLEHSLRYAQQRKQFCNSILSYQAVSHKIADMYVGYRAARAMLLEVCNLIDAGKRANQEAAALKIYASEMATKVALEAVQIMGGYGYIREFPVERLMRDAKLLEIGGGTSEILRDVIVKEMERRQ